MIPRLTGNRKMWSEQLAVWTGWGFNLWFLLGIFTILAGRTQGREYAEFIWPLDIMLIVLWFSTVFNMLMTVAVRRVRPLYVTTWWALAAPLWLGADYIIGTLHGLLQLLPATAQYLTTPEELPNIHAQLNMVGGVLLVLIGVVYLLLPELVGQPMDQRLARITLVGIGGGISSYYIVTLVAGLLRFGYLLQGMDNVQSALHLGWVTPALLMLTSIPMLVGYGAFGLAVLRVTGGYRTTMAQELRQAPARFNGPVPTRLKRMPMVYILGMEAAGSLFGWPGLGWLYAGQAMPGVALLLLGPAVAWALLPMLFSPFTDTALSQWGWVVLLVWLPGSALLSCTLLAFYLHRIRGSASALKPAQPAKLQEVPALEPVVPAKSTMPTKSGTRIPRRMVVGAAILLLFLISVPLVPLLVRVPSEVVAQSLMPELPDRANGAYLEVSNSTQSGLLKLFTWSFALDKVPDSAPLLSTAYFQGIRIRQKGLDDPARYQLFRMEDDQSIAFTVQSIAFQQEMALTPETRLPEGDYLLSIPTGGMFAGREYYYFRLTSAAAPFPQMVAEPVVALPLASASVPVAAPWLTLFPLSSALISLLAAVVMAQRLWLKIRPHEAAWTVAFALFGLAAASQVVGDEWGWTPTLARLYYVCGATLVVGWLGLGTWLLLVRRPWLRSAGLWCTLLLSGYGIGLINMTPINDSLLSTAGWHALDKSFALTILTIGINSVGTVVLVGGALWSAWLFWRRGVMQQRMVGCILLAVGALTVAAGGSLTRLGHQQYLYIAMSSGVLLMFWGYLKTIQPATKPQVPVASPGTLGAVGLR